jgi:hypothetical protein
MSGYDSHSHMLGLNSHLKTTRIDAHDEFVQLNAAFVVLHLHVEWQERYGRSMRARTLAYMAHTSNGSLECTN